MDLNARVDVNCGRKDGLMDNRTPILHLAKAGATKTVICKKETLWHYKSPEHFDQGALISAASAKFPKHLRYRKMIHIPDFPITYGNPDISSLMKTNTFCFFLNFFYSLYNCIVSIVL